MLRIGDVVVQHENHTVWYMVRAAKETTEPHLVGLCVHTGAGRLWSVRDDSPFQIDPLNDGVEIVTNLPDFDTALAAAQLGAFDAVRWS